jgi:hypothetical protein
MDRKYLCFLDIDGVLTSSRVHTTFQGEYGMWCQFDPIAIQFFNWIHDTYPIEFAIMSTWKNHISETNDIHTEHWVRAAFANSGFRGMIAKPWKTDPDNFAVMKKWDRGHEVKDYLENFGRDIEDFILFDDNQYRFKEILGKQRLVRTDHENGMLYKHMLNAKSIMGNWEKKK